MTNSKQSAGRKTASQFSIELDINSALCRMDMSQIKAIYERVDGKQNNVKKTTLEHDYYNLFVGCNIWLYLFEDVVKESCISLRNRILLCGIQFCIEEADEHRKYMISEGQNGTCSTFWSKYFDLDHVMHIDLTPARVNSRIAGPAFQNMLNLLGCLRRMRLESLDYSFMYTDYLALNSKCRDWNTRDYVDYGDVQLAKLIAKENNDPWLTKEPSTLLSRDDFELQYPSATTKLIHDLRDVITWIFSGYTPDRNLFELPPGVPYEGSKTYLEKFKIVLRNQAWLREHGVNIPWVPVDQEEPADCNRYVIVPKDFSKGRGVAPEPVSRQVLGYQVSEGMRRCLKHFGVTLNDQGKNQKFCSRARHDDMDTIDKKNASDSISVRLVDALFRDCPELLRDLKACRTSYIEVNGKRYPNYRFCTMGNAITCDVQSSIYLAIGIVAIDYAIALFDDLKHLRKCQDDIQFYSNHLVVYNDDVIITHFASDLYIQIAEKLGFSINRSKTYTSKDRYRESCGVEYYTFKGNSYATEVTSTIYPRGTSRYALPELVSLQHKYYAYGGVNGFLSSVILDAFPSITSSEPNSIYMDIWIDRPVADTEDIYEHYKLVHKFRVYKKVNKPDSLSMKSKETMYNYTPEIFTTTDKNQVYHIGSEYYDTIIYLGWAWNCDEDTVTQAERHTTTTVKRHVKPLTAKQDAELVELLAYLLRIGDGAVKVNQSDYTRIESLIDTREDLYCSRTVRLTNTLYK